MVAGGVGDEFAGVCGGHAGTGNANERVGGVLLRAFEVGGVEVVFVSGEGADDFLLKVERGDGAAGEVVVEAAVLHGGPVADGGDVEGGGGAVTYDELLDGLQRVEDA